MTKLTRNGTSISLGAHVTEILREAKAQMPEYSKMEFSPMIRWLVAERLNDTIGKKNGVDYIKAFGLK